MLVSTIADDSQSAELTLLSPNETTIGKAYNDASFIGHPEILEALIDEKLAEADVDGISDWRLPTYTLWCCSLQVAWHEPLSSSLCHELQTALH